MKIVEPILQAFKEPQELLKKILSITSEKAKLFLKKINFLEENFVNK